MVSVLFSPKRKTIFIYYCNIIITVFRKSLDRTKILLCRKNHTQAHEKSNVGHIKYIYVHLSGKTFGAKGVKKKNASVIVCSRYKSSIYDFRTSPIFFLYITIKIYPKAPLIRLLMCQVNIRVLAKPIVCQFSLKSFCLFDFIKIIIFYVSCEMYAFHLDQLNGDIFWLPSMKGRKKCT